jgi:transposase, IS5 family
MTPKQLEPGPQDDWFNIRLEDLVGQHHALVRMATVIHWDLLDDQLGAEFCATADAPAWLARLTHVFAAPLQFIR